MVYLLPIAMITITIALYTVGNQIIISPSMLFMIPFSFSAVWLTFNIARWDVVLNTNTFCVIIGGCLSYLLGILLATPEIKRRRLRIKVVYLFKKHSEEDIISDGFLWVVAIIEIAILFLCLRAIRVLVHRYGYYGDLSYEIYRFRNLGQYTSESTSLGQGLEWLYNFNIASGFVWVYTVAHRLVNKTKLSIPLIICIVVSLLTGLIRGGRQSAVQIIVAGLVYFFIFFFAKYQSRKIPLKTILKILVIVILMAVSFQSVGTLLGRTVKADFMQYIAVYFCGGIRNLNEWLKSSHKLPEIFGKQTFANLYPYLGRKIGRSEWIYVMDLPYLKGNGLNSGNIYTTFYAFIYDFGYIGAFIMPLIMGFVSEVSYKKSRRAKPESEKNISLSIILYGYIAYLLVFSFFSNKFYEGIVKQSFLKNVIIWILLSIVLNQLKEKRITNFKRVSFRQKNHISDAVIRR